MVEVGAEVAMEEMMMMMMMIEDQEAEATQMVEIMILDKTNDEIRTRHKYHGDLQGERRIYTRRGNFHLIHSDSEIQKRTTLTWTRDTFLRTSRDKKIEYLQLVLTGSGIKMSAVESKSIHRRF